MSVAFLIGHLPSHFGKLHFSYVVLSIFSYIHLEKPDLAQNKLQECLQKHPGLLFPLLEKMQAEPCPELG